MYTGAMNNVPVWASRIFTRACADAPVAAATTDTATTSAARTSVRRAIILPTPLEMPYPPHPLTSGPGTGDQGPENWPPHPDPLNHSLRSGSGQALPLPAMGGEGNAAA